MLWPVGDIPLETIGGVLGAVTALFVAGTTWFKSKMEMIRRAEEEGRDDEATALGGFSELTRELREDINRRAEEYAEERGRLRHEMEVLSRRVQVCEEDRQRLHHEVTTLAARIEAILATLPISDQTRAIAASTEAAHSVGSPIPGGRRGYDPPDPANGGNKQ